MATPKNNRCSSPEQAILAPTSISPDLQDKIRQLAVLRTQILRYGRTYKKLREKNRGQTHG